MTSDSLDWATAALGLSAAELTDVGSYELAGHLNRWSGRLQRAAEGPPDL